MSTAPLNRRKMLKAAGVCLGLPLLDSLQPKLAASETSAPPTRLLAVCQDLGFIPSQFFPTDAGRDYTLSPHLRHISDFREQFTVFSGLSHPEVDGGHRADQSFLTAAPHPGRPSFRNRISLDQRIASEIGHRTRFRSLSLAVNLPKSLSFTQAGVEIPPIESAAALFRQLFLQGSAHETERQVERLRRRGSVLDAVLGQAEDLHRRVSAEDRRRLDQYQTAVRDLETRLEEQRAWEQRPKPKVAHEMPTDPPDKKEYFDRVRLMYRMSRLALQTDSTRLITLFLSSATTPGIVFGDGRSYPGYHGISHHGKDETKLQQLRQIETEQMKAFGELLRECQSVDEGNGTLLDHTMLLYGSNLGDANVHDNRNLPVILAGGGFRHGQHLVFDRDNNTPLCNLFVSMLQRLGIESDQFASSNGTLDGLEFRQS